MKLIKIKFTAWRDQSVAPREKVLQEQLDACTTRIGVLSAAAAQMKLEQAHANTKMLQNSLARITGDLEKIDAAHTSLLSAEKVVADAEAQAALKHRKVGTFGYQVFNKGGTYVALIVDEAGEYLPGQAVYSYELVDENPPLPQWAKDGKFGHFE